MHHGTMFPLAHRVALWIAKNPRDFLEYFLLFYTLGNILWAQLPAPKSDRGKKVWLFFHSFFQFVVTHKSDRGTFTWPSIIYLTLRALAFIGNARLPDQERITTPPAPKPKDDEVPPMVVHTENTPVEVPHPSLHPDEAPTPVMDVYRLPQEANPMLDLDELEPAIPEPPPKEKP